MPANITQNTGRYWWALILAFVLGAAAALWITQPYLCNVKVNQNGKATVCHGGPIHTPGSR